MTRVTAGEPITLKAAAAAAGPRQQMDRSAWIEKSLEILASAGVAAIRVEVLARELDVTKGSFYWHFRDRAALLTATIAEWRNRTTTNVVQHLWGQPQDPRTKLRRLWQICFSGRADNPGGRLEVAIRQWALHDATVAATVAQNDAERIVFVEELYHELGVRAIATNTQVAARPVDIDADELGGALDDAAGEVAAEGAGQHGLGEASLGADDVARVDRRGLNFDKDFTRTAGRGRDLAGGEGCDRAVCVDPERLHGRKIRHSAQSGPTIVRAHARPRSFRYPDSARAWDSRSAVDGPGIGGPSSGSGWRVVSMSWMTGRR